MVKLTISSNEADQRLDRFLKKYLRKASLSAIYKIIRKDLKLNGKRAKEDTMLREGDELALYMTEDKLAELTALPKKKSAKKQFKIPYEDDNLLIADKPWGLLTHGDSHEKKNTLVNQVCGYLQDKGEYLPSRERTFTPAPVNRLDRNTTGLVIFGKNAETLRSFTRMIRERDSVEKYYMTIVCGSFKEEMRLEGRLAKDTDKNIASIAGEDDGKEAFTYARPVITGKKFSLVEVRIHTGRTHQIRVHLADAGFPLAGDIKYGNKDINMKLKKHGITTQMLHAYKLRFTQMPESLAYLEGKTVEAELPAEFARVRDLLVD